jgi:hypothetical protein
VQTTLHTLKVCYYYSMKIVKILVVLITAFLMIYSKNKIDNQNKERVKVMDNNDEETGFSTPAKKK